MKKRTLFLFLIFQSVFFSSFAQEIRMGLPLGHIGSVNSAQFSPSGKYIVTSSYDHTAKIWETASGKLLHSLDGHTGSLNKAVFSPDGTLVLTTSEDKIAKIWGVSNGDLLLNLGGDSVEINTAIFSPDGKWILTTSENNIIKIWETISGQLSQTIEAQIIPIVSTNFSPDGKKILTASDDGTVKIWDISEGKLLHSLEGGGGWAKGVFSPDGKSILTLAGQVKIWDANNGKLLFTLIGHKIPIITTAAFSSDGKKIITGSVDKTAIIWEAKSGKLLCILEGHNAGIQTAVFNNDASTVLTSSWDNTVKYWDAVNGKLLHDFVGHNEKVTSAVYSPDEKNILTASLDNTAKIWDLEKGKLLHTLEGQNSIVRAIDFSPTGDNFVTSVRENPAQIWDNYTGKQKASLYGDSWWWITSAVFSPDGGKVLTLSQTGKIWDAATGELDQVIEEISTSALFAKFSPNGKMIIAGYRDSTVKLLDVDSGKQLYRLEGHTDNISCANFNADGGKIVTASMDHTVRIWDSNSGKLLHTVAGHSASVNYAIFSFDGNRILSASEDGTARLWNAENGELLLSLNGDHGPVDFANFNPDGSSILTVHEDGAVINWESSTGRLIQTLHGPADPIDVEFSNKGRSILAFNSDTVIMWNTNSGQIINTFSPDGKFGAMDRQNQRLISYSNSILSFWDINSGKILCSLIALGTSDVVITHPSGLFDATPGAMEQMYWVKGLEVIEFNQLKDRYWEPGLWEKVMKGETLRDVRGMNELKLQPEVELAEVKDGKLPISLSERDGGYGRVVVMINGKEVEADVRGNGFDTTKSEQTIYYNLKDNPLLVPGQENQITVKAWSADGFVEGRGTVITYTPTGNSVSTPPSIFAVVLGVSDYSSSAIHLNYAKPDATAIASAIQLGASTLFGKDRTFVYTLTSPGILIPTKENIQKVFAEIKTKAKPNDILMLYMSGHGITWGGDGGDFYYLTADAYSSSMEAYNDPAIRAKNAISTMEFTEWIKDIPALKQLMIIDACGSGKAVDNLLAQRSVDPSQIKAIDRMKDRTGMFIISGCAADAVSYEASRYGQGLLTYTLLQAMKGAALREDKYVDVNTLLNYAREQVPLLAAGVGGLQQPQLLIPKGGSFDIGILDENARKEIVLASPKPVYVRSTFLDVDQLEDVLGLAKSIDEALSGISAKGNDSPLIFVDTRDYPDGCKISGSYTQLNGTITLKYKIKCGNTVGEYADEGNTVEIIVRDIITKAGSLSN